MIIIIIWKCLISNDKKKIDCQLILLVICRQNWIINHVWEMILFALNILQSNLGNRSVKWELETMKLLLAFMFSLLLAWGYVANTSSLSSPMILITARSTSTRLPWQETPRPSTPPSVTPIDGHFVLLAVQSSLGKLKCCYCNRTANRSQL